MDSHAVKTEIRDHALSAMKSMKLAILIAYDVGDIERAKALTLIRDAWGREMARRNADV